MKFKFDIKNKKAEAEADIEKLVEKGMDSHEKNWKEKFSVKHTAKKEIMELKHKQKIEVEELNNKKKGIIDKIIDTRIREKEIELEEIRRKEEEEKKNKKIEIIIGISGFIIGLILVISGAVATSRSNNPDNPLYFIIILGFLILISSATSFLFDLDEKKDSKKKR